MKTSIESPVCIGSARKMQPPQPLQPLLLPPLLMPPLLMPPLLMPPLLLKPPPPPPLLMPPPPPLLQPLPPPQPLQPPPHLPFRRYCFYDFIGTVQTLLIRTIRDLISAQKKCWELRDP